MSDRFTQFSNAFSPTLVDWLVGYGLAGASTIEKRWTGQQWLDLIQSNLVIDKLDGGEDNYILGIGSTAGAGSVTIRPAGADPNMDLILEGLGTGVVQFAGTLTVSGDLNLGGNDLITGGGDVLTGGGAINTANGTVSLGAGNLQMSSGTITLTTGNLVVSAGDITISNTGTLNINGGTFQTDTLAVSLLGFITCEDDLSVGVGGDNKAVTTSGVVGNKDAGGAGSDPIDLVFTGVTDVTGESFHRGKAFFDLDVMTNSYIRGSESIGQTADVTSVQGGGLITKEFNQYSTVANPGDCATLPAIIQEGYALSPRTPYLHIIVRNDGVSSMDVFPNTGGTINGGAVNAAVAVGAGSVEHFYGAYNGGANAWFTA